MHENVKVLIHQAGRQDGNPDIIPPYIDVDLHVYIVHFPLSAPGGS